MNEITRNIDCIFAGFLLRCGALNLVSVATIIRAPQIRKNPQIYSQHFVLFHYQQLASGNGYSAVARVVITMFHLKSESKNKTARQKN